MPKVALVTSRCPEKAELTTELGKQGYEVLFVPIGIGGPLDLGVLRLNEVMNKLEGDNQCVIVGVGLDEVPPGFEDVEQSFYSWIRNRACNYESSVIVIEEEDMRVFKSIGYKVDTIGIKTRRELAAKALMFTSDRDRGLQMNLLANYGKSVLVVGSGGREHALTHALSESSKVDKIYVAGGNGGVKSMGPNVEVIAGLNVSGGSYIDELVTFATQRQVALVVIGPEQPLIDGVVDALELANIPVFGPSLAAAQLEASKAYSKEIFSKYGLPTATYRTFKDYTQACEYVKSVTHKVVVKASGIAAGKGVIMPSSTEEALAAVKLVMVDKVFGPAGDECVIEEWLQGEEVSVLAFCDGKRAVAMPAAQDHKRAYDGDRGPNTGGMGAYAPTPCVTPTIRKKIEDILQRTVEAMAAEGRPYRGCLFGGFMLTPDNGPMILEFNCRFGDPEAQVVLPLLHPQSDLFEIMLSCSAKGGGEAGGLRPSSVQFEAGRYACAVVCASKGYPGSYPKGITISGIEEAGALPGVQIYHAGTELSGAKSGDNSGTTLVTSGGRVVAVTGSSESLEAAIATAYKGVQHVSFEGKEYRSDVGKRALEAPVMLGVVGSTRGTSLQAVIDAIEGGALHARITCVLSDKADTGILERATKHGLHAVHIPSKTADGRKKSRAAYDAEVTTALESQGVQLVLMVGYMRIVSPDFTSRWNYRCINVHPSLLPDFAGGMDLAVHSAVLAAGKKRSGCTVHFVTAEVDGGPIVVQSTCEVMEDDTPESLKARVQALEGVSFIKAIEMYRQGVIGPSASGPHGGGRIASTLTYADAGVDIDAGEMLVERIKPFCKATRRSGCDASLGGFGGLFDLAQAGYDPKETVLVSGTDGVGTKLKIAQSIGKHSTIGIDLVAMCVNDILVCGAEPLFFLDYYACGRLDVDVASEVVKGIAAGCAESGCALIGGETAEMAGMYSNGEYDLAGFSVGAVRKSDMLPKSISPGDVLLALPSSGVHSNGYSLVRKCVERSGLAWDSLCPYPCAPEGLTLGESLLMPTRLYVKPVLPLIKRGITKGMAHITGGGLLDNIPRILPPHTAAFLDFKTAGYSLPPVFRWLQKYANLPQSELLRTFNCGIGMVLVVAPENEGAALAMLRETVPDAFAIGKLIARDGCPPVVTEGVLE